MTKPVSITAIASVSALGNNTATIRESYLAAKPLFGRQLFTEGEAYTATLQPDDQHAVEALRQSDLKYRSLDDTVLFALLASRAAVQQSGWENGDFGINIGSSRGATALFEKHHKTYLETGKTATLASPVTTLGNISSWVAHDLRAIGPEASHSITCSTSLHAMLNGIAWLKAGMAERFLVGGSEAPLTAFTIAQMKAMKIYARDEQEYPCRALDFSKIQNTMILGEGAAVCCLENGVPAHALAVVAGYGYATEILEHNASISAEADCFKKSMKMALAEMPLEEVDVIVMHAPGTIKGDLSEYKAIASVFGERLPLLTTNKWITGHTFGASGMLAIEMAVLMLQEQYFFGVPYTGNASAAVSIKKVLVNSVGFGGNAVSILLALPV